MKGCERKVIEYLCRCLGLRWSCFIQQKEKAATSVWQRRNRLHSWIDSMVNLISMYASDKSQCCSIKVLIFARVRPFYQTEISLAICNSAAHTGVLGVAALCSTVSSRYRLVRTPHFTLLLGLVHTQIQKSTLLVFRSTSVFPHEGSVRHNKKAPSWIKGNADVFFFI